MSYIDQLKETFIKLLFVWNYVRLFNEQTGDFQDTNEKANDKTTLTKDTWEWPVSE